MTLAESPGSGFENSASSNLGFITTFSIVVFSGGTGVSRSPNAVFATARTLVSRDVLQIEMANRESQR
jgi:hypothetical protein